MTLKKTQIYAQSIAVDNGSVDFISDGTTSTVNLIDDVQVFDSNPNIQRFTEKLDIGYHYDCGQNDIDEYTKWSGIIHPQKEVPMFPYSGYDLYPLVANSHEFSIATVDNPSTAQGNPKESHTIVTYHSAPCEPEDPSGTLYRYYGVLSYNYESGDSQLIKWHTYEDITWHGEDFVLCPIVTNIASTAIPTTTIDEEEYQGTIFAGYVCDWRGLYHNEGVAEPYQDRIEIWIYRYNSEDREWYPIAKVVWLMQGITNENGGHKITDLTLCAKGNDLWVFWTGEKLIYDEGDQKWFNSDWYIYGAYLPEAVTRSSTLEMVIGTDYNDIANINSIADNNVRLDCGYDDNVSLPRVIFTDTINNKNDIVAYRVLLNDNIPYSLTAYDNLTSGQAGDYKSPYMAMNKPANNFSITEDAFGTFFKDSSNCYKAYLIDDDWTYDGTINGPLDTSNSIYPDVEGRGFGTQRICFKSSSNFIATNTEILPNPSLQNINVGGLGYPRISRNIENKTDLFIISTNISDIVITQIDP